MKTQIKKLKLFVGLLALTLLAAGCGKSSSTSSTNSEFSLINGMCYDTIYNYQVSASYCTTSSTYNSSLFSWNGSTCTLLSTGTAVNSTYCTSNPFSMQASGCYDSYGQQYVNSSYCSSVGSTTGLTYTYSNGLCYASNGQVVSSSYCSTSSTQTAYTECYGTYLYTAYSGYSQIVQCYGANCRGYTLQNPTTGQQTVCK